jgi:hypothetical protein
MSNHDTQKLSAQVILRPEGGKESPSPERITSENVHQLMPSGKDFEKARNYFADLGFEVAAGFANSFSITGDAKLFEKAFRAKLTTGEKQAVKASGEDQTESSQLPLGALPGDMKNIIEAITFTEPPDFGPGNF